MAKVIGGLVVAFVAILVILAAMPFTIISAGEVGVVTNLGKVSRTLEPGFHWVSPFVEDVNKIDVRVQKEETDADAASSDVQGVNTRVAVNYTIRAEEAAAFYSEIKSDYKETIIAPAIQESVKAATSKYTATELQTERAAVADTIQADLETRLNKYHLVVLDVSIVNFGYSPEFTRSVENKVAAEQDNLASQSRLEQARNDAAAIRAKSEAANNEKYVELQRLEVEKAAIEKWNGVLPTQMIPGATIPFINLTKTQ